MFFNCVKAHAHGEKTEELTYLLVESGFQTVIEDSREWIIEGCREWIIDNCRVSQMAVEWIIERCREWITEGSVESGS